MALKIKKEVQKPLNTRFIRVAYYPQWAADIILVPKKDMRVRMCVHFRDLNKVSLKNDFSLPNIDILVDNMARSVFLSFLDRHAITTKLRCKLKTWRRLPSLLCTQLTVTL